MTPRSKGKTFVVYYQVRDSAAASGKEVWLPLSRHGDRRDADAVAAAYYRRTGKHTKVLVEVHDESGKSVRKWIVRD